MAVQLPSSSASSTPGVSTPSSAASVAVSLTSSTPPTVATPSVSVIPVDAVVSRVLQSLLSSAQWRGLSPSTSLLSTTPSSLSGAPATLSAAPAPAPLSGTPASLPATPAVLPAQASGPLSHSFQEQAHVSHFGVFVRCTAFMGWLACLGSERRAGLSIHYYLHTV